MAEILADEGYISQEDANPNSLLDLISNAIFAESEGGRIFSPGSTRLAEIESVERQIDEASRLGDELESALGQPLTDDEFAYLDQIFSEGLNYEIERANTRPNQETQGDSGLVGQGVSGSPGSRGIDQEGGSGAIAGEIEESQSFELESYSEVDTARIEGQNLDAEKVQDQADLERDQFDLTAPSAMIEGKN